MGQIQFSHTTRSGPLQIWAVISGDILLQKGARVFERSEVEGISRVKLKRVVVAVGANGTMELKGEDISSLFDKMRVIRVFEGGLVAQWTMGLLTPGNNQEWDVECGHPNRVTVDEPISIDLLRRFLIAKQMLVLPPATALAAAC